MTAAILLWLMTASLSPQTDQLPVRAPDVEATGWLRNISYEAIDDPDDLLGHGWITAEFRISKVLHGRQPPSKLITIRYLAHTYRSTRTALRLRLRLREDGTYIVCAQSGGEGLVCG